MVKEVGWIRTSEKLIPKNSLKPYYIMKFFFKGLIEIICTPFKLSFIAACWALVIIAFRSLTNYGNEILINITHGLYAMSLILASVTVTVLVIVVNGLPRHFLRINQNLIRVGLVNAARECPVLLQRESIDDRSEIWHFESFGIGFSAWKDCFEELESALDIGVVSIDRGKNEREVLLNVTISPGPWPERIEWDNGFMDPSEATIVLGTDRISPVIVDLKKYPHILISGKTGSGKSVLLKSIILQALYKSIKVYIIDFKGGADYIHEFSSFCRIITTDDECISLLESLVEERKRRVSDFIKQGCSDIDEYNKKTSAKISRVIVVIDELAECLDKSGNKKRREAIYRIEDSLSTLHRLGRSAGIHCVCGGQRNSADIVNGQIRNNAYKIMGSCDENLSILTTGSADAARRIPIGAHGRFIDENDVMFQGYYSDYPSKLFESLDHYKENENEKEKRT